MQLGRNGPPRHTSWVDSQQSLYGLVWLAAEKGVDCYSERGIYFLQKTIEWYSTEYGMGGNEGPRVEINATCFPCRYVNSDGPELYCLRPQAAEKFGSPADDRGKYIGTHNLRTP